jgi:very-short-patch-repair endonuclease/predicted transcriptional regulator of viral defense system
MHANRRVRGVDRAIAELAERQHGVVSRTQLASLGLTRGAIGHRLRRRLLHPLYHGVYAVGHAALSREGRWMAAVLACGPDGVLSHRSAAALWGMLQSARGRVEVTVPKWRRPHSNIQIHQALIPSDEMTFVGGIPVTTVPRTLLDLAAIVDRRRVERAIEQAEVLRLTDRLSLGDLVARYPRRQGVATVRAVLAGGRVGATITRSELEERFLAFLEEAVLPRPELNARMELGGAWVEVDCLWRPEKLIVELDGYGSHGTRAAFERDRARDRLLQAAGWRVVRITWRQLHDEPATVAADLRALMDPGPPTKESPP